MKCYLEVYSAPKKATHLPIAGGLVISWDKYSFDLHDNTNFYPKGRKTGDQSLSIMIFFFHWGIKLFFYKPTQPEYL